jgi:hypothetical protein
MLAGRPATERRGTTATAPRLTAPALTASPSAASRLVDLAAAVDALQGPLARVARAPRTL